MVGMGESILDVPLLINGVHEGDHQGLPPFPG